MNLATAMLYPVMLLLPAAGVVDEGRSADENGLEVSRQSVEEGRMAHGWGEQPWPVFESGTRAQAPAWPFTVTAFQRVEPESAWQVRIEQRVTIRIAPRASRPVSPDMFAGLPDGEIGSHFSERKIGKCLPADAIAGVQPDRDNRLLLFMRDRRIVSAELERACRARDFYSGFYLSLIHI